jgi:exosome complex exonuclease RRP6
MFVLQTECHWVDTEEQLQELVEKLDNVTEFAIDLEHHGLRSYQGITCLMQVRCTH